MSMLQTVAMATNNWNDNQFFAIFHLFASFSRVSLGKISWNSTVLWKRLIWKNEKFIYRILKNLTISFFWFKKRNPEIKFFPKIALWRRHLLYIMNYTNFHKISPKEIWEKGALIFSSFASLWRRTISRRPRAHAC